MESVLTLDSATFEALSSEVALIEDGWQVGILLPESDSSTISVTVDGVWAKGIDAIAGDFSMIDLHVDLHGISSAILEVFAMPLVAAFKWCVVVFRWTLFLIRLLCERVFTHNYFFVAATFVL